MSFHHRYFLMFFFPLACMLFVCFPRARTGLIALLSLGFLGFESLGDLALLLMSVMFNWSAYLVLRKPHRFSRVFLGLVILMNLLLLIVTKKFYSMIALATIPLGVSFYTFQQIGFQIDNRNRKISNVKVTEFLFAATFFPHLPAGPIVRFSDILDQIRVKNWTTKSLQLSLPLLILLLIGLSKKILIADQLAPIVNAAYDDIIVPGLVISITHFLLATFGYGLQIYFDFSGYSDIAISMAGILGITFPFNFNSPYKSYSVADFWRRWHISLSSFIREYLYDPLRRIFHSSWSRPFCILFVMALVGLWHGFTLSFLAWGVAHGVLIVLSHQFKLMLQRNRVTATIISFVFVSLLWPLFRDIEHTALVRLFSISDHVLDVTSDATTHLAALVVIGFLVFFFPNSQETYRLVASKDFSVKSPFGKLAVFCIVVWMCSLLMMSGYQDEFIYFKF